MEDQNQSFAYHFILIHIGNDLPDYFNSCIRQIRLFNSPGNNMIWVLANEAELEKIADCGSLRKIPLASIGSSQAHLYFREHFTNDSLNNFWKYTIERFFYLEEIMRKYDLKNGFHLENDVLLYVNLADLLPVFTENYSGLAVTLDCDYRVIPGFMFVREFHPLALLNQFINGMIVHNRNDMQILADFMYAIKNTNIIDTLPILITEYDKPLRNLVGFTSVNRQRYTNHFDRFQGIFDGAAIGQYLGGISPRNNAQGHDTRGFINETCVFQCNYLNFKWESNENGLKSPFLSYANMDKWHPIFTIHVHSKNLAAFISK